MNCRWRVNRPLIHVVYEARCLLVITCCGPLKNNYNDNHGGCILGDMPIDEVNIVVESNRRTYSACTTWEKLAEAELVNAEIVVTKDTDATQSQTDSYTEHIYCTSYPELFN